MFTLAYPQIYQLLYFEVCLRFHYQKYKIFKNNLCEKNIKLNTSI